MSEAYSNEIWREIPETNGIYSVSNFGRVRHNLKCRLVSVSVDRKGYRRVNLAVPKWHSAKVHKLVALAFVGPCPEAMQVNHKDGDKSNNAPENLEYVTGQENMRHSFANGFHKPSSWAGARHGKAKLNDEAAKVIIASYPMRSLQNLASEFGVTKQAIWQVVHRKTWTHV